MVERMRRGPPLIGTGGTPTGRPLSARAPASPTRGPASREALGLGAILFLSLLLASQLLPLRFVFPTLLQGLNQLLCPSQRLRFGLSGSRERGRAGGEVAAAGEGRTAWGAESWTRRCAALAGFARARRFRGRCWEASPYPGVVDVDELVGVLPHQRCAGEEEHTSELQS